MDKVLESIQKDMLIVHVITDFSGIGGAEMMLSRLIKHTTNDYKHIIISLMGVSDVYKDTLDQCQEYYNLNWNGLNTVKIIFKLKKILKKISPCTIQCWMYHANVLTTISQLGRTDKPDIFWCDAIYFEDSHIENDRTFVFSGHAWIGLSNNVGSECKVPVTGKFCISSTGKILKKYTLIFYNGSQELILSKQ